MIYTAGLSAPWALAMPAGTAHFHFVESGSATIVSDDIAPIALHAGELLLLPRGKGHTLRDADGGAVTAVELFATGIYNPDTLVIEHGGGGEPTRIVSGTFHFPSPRRICSPPAHRS